MKTIALILCIGIVWISLFPTDACSAPDPSVWSDLGLNGGYVLSLAVDPDHPETVFSGISGGPGLFRSIDGAANWQALEMAGQVDGEDTFENQSLMAVVVAPDNPQVVWAAHNLWVAKSTDGGTTWTHIRNDTMQKYCRNCSGSDRDRGRFCHCIAIDPHDAETVYVGTAGPSNTYTGGAVFRTTDGGGTWEKLNDGIDLDYGVWAVTLHPQKPGVIGIVTSSYGTGGAWDGTVYLSIDNGGRFTSPDPKPISGSGLNGLTWHPEDPDVAFITGGIGVVRMVVEGPTWYPVMAIPDSNLAAPVVFAPGDPKIAYAGWNRPAGANWGGDGLPRLSRSLDGGQTWETDTLDPAIASIPNALAVDPHDARILYWGDAGGGVLKSADGGRTWRPVNQGLNGIVVNDVDTDPRQSAHLIAATTAGVYERLDGQWHKRLNLYAEAVRFDPKESTAYFAGLWGTLARTTDGGQTWRFSSDGADGDISHIAIDPVEPDRLFITDQSHVRRSLDDGETFTAVLAGVNSAGQSHRMNVVAIDPGNPLRILAGGGNFEAPRVVGGLWQSLDGGDTWQITGLSGVIVNDVLIHPAYSEILLAGCGCSSNMGIPLFKSMDGGVNWSPADNGLPPKHILLNAVWTGEAGGLFAAGYGGRILHLLDGRVEALNSGTEEQLFDIFGIDSQAVFAVGDKGTILRFDGTTWTPMASPTATTLNGIWGPSSERLYAVGMEGRILRYTGGQWSVMTSLVSTELHDIFGTAADDVMAVGAAGTIVHYDGQRWAPMAGPASEDLYAVWGATNGQWFAAGDNGTILAFDGNIWSVMDSGTQNDIQGIWGLAADDVYAVTGIGGQLLHYDGSTWRVSTTADDLSVDTYALFVDICAGPDHRLYIAQKSGGIFSYDGSRWETLRPPGNRFRSVTDLAFHRQDPDIVYAATWRAGVYISPIQGDRWLNLGTPLLNVNAIAAGSLYAATDGGLYQLTGTGIIAGRVRDMLNARAIDGALVSTDLGNQCRAIAGDYMMVMPAGIFDAYATADNYRMAATGGLMVAGSDVTWHDFEMKPGAAGPPANIPDSSGTTPGHADGGSYCFIGILVGDIPGTRPAIIVWIAATLFWVPASKVWTRLVLCCTIVAGAVAFLLPPETNAATLFQQVDIASPPVPVGSGARAMGMGGAFIATADDATAASWNSAGLIQLEKPEISVVGAYAYQWMDFESDLHPESNGDHSDDNIALNYFSVSFPVHWIKNFVFSINYQRLYEFKRSFAHRINYALSGLDLRERRSFRQSGCLSAVGFAGAVELTPHLSAGGTLNVWTDELGWDNGWTEHCAAHATGSQAGVPVTIHTTITDKYEKFRGINFNIGVLWETDHWGRLGAVIKTPFSATLVHHNRFEQTTVYGAPVNTTTQTGPISLNEEVELEMPLSYGAGWSKRFRDSFTLNLDLYRVHWDRYTLTDSQGNAFSPIDGRPKAQSRIDPTTHIRIGGEYVVLLAEHQTAVPVRAGLFYDPEPGQGGSRDFFGVALGSGITRKRFSFDAAYQLRWARDVDSGNLVANATADVIEHTVLISIIYYL